MQSLADAMQAEAEAAALEAAEADAKRELRRLETQVNRGDPLTEAQLAKLEQLTRQLEGADHDDADEHAFLEEAMPDTLAGMVWKLLEIKTVTDLLVLVTMLCALVAGLVLVTLPFGSYGFVYGLPHRAAHFIAVGGLSAEAFVVISLLVAWRAERWQPAPVRRPASRGCPFCSAPLSEPAARRAAPGARVARLRLRPNACVWLRWDDAIDLRVDVHHRRDRAAKAWAWNARIDGHPGGRFRHHPPPAVLQLSAVHVRRRDSDGQVRRPALTLAPGVADFCFLRTYQTQPGFTQALTDGCCTVGGCS